MHCQALTLFLTTEIERVPRFCWSWSPLIGFTIF